MSQQWISEAGTRVEGDARYAPVNQAGEAVGETVFLRRGQTFPATPNDSIGWLEKDALSSSASARPQP